ncbi:MAG: Gfo/Idh/MocA family oxidoreductase, partial [Chitinivibrionales bacterium]|nr:Gfo/Idh/MocA family oxidoreductase [Chitinivibrionales bacterium]
MGAIGIGVIGCGGRLEGLIGRILADHNKNGQLKLTAVFDPDPKRTELFRRRFNSRADEYRSFKELVKRTDVDWVFIGSWNCFHKEHAVAALNAHKNVFCEKPLATTLTDCLAIKRAVKANKQKFLLGFTLRYSPHYLKIKKIVDSGVIGKIVSMEFNETLDFNHGGYIMSDWRRLTKNAGSHVLEKCCHDIDLVNWIVQS